MTAEEYIKLWKDFEDKCNNCNSCGLRATANNVVVFRGARHANLMIIGEGPGEQEDIEGKPFVGKSGQLLQTLINAMGFTNKDYHICNIVKCRPPENRKPADDEIKACKKLLAEQFKLVMPKVILLCGATAYEAFFGERKKMGEVRGFWVEKNGYLILTTYHPAYIARYPEHRVKLYEDVLKVKEKMQELGLM